MPKGQGNQFGAAADDYGRYRSGFPSSLFNHLANFNIGLPGQTIVDLGTGTGNLARNFAQRGCIAIGVDPDARMIQKAKELDANENYTIEYIVAKAEQTGLDDNLAELVIAGQCWHWFDRPTAVKEVLRLLKPNGKIVITHFDWLLSDDNVAQVTEDLILKYNPEWNMSGGNGRYPHWKDDLINSEFGNIQTFSYDVDVPYTHEAWRGRIRSNNGVIPLGDRVARFDNDLKQILFEKFPDDPLTIPHRLFAVLATKPG